MSLVQVQGNASGTGTLTIAAPNTNSNYTLTLPQATTTIVGTDATQTLTNKTIQGGAITSGTAVNSTSGTSIDFTGLPAWVKRVTISLSGVSTSGASNQLFQLGTSGGVVSTGYTAGATFVGAGTANANYTTGIGCPLNGSGDIRHGHIIFTLHNFSTNLWVSTGTLVMSNGGYTSTMGGSVTLSSALTSVRCTTVNGTDTFDLGSINILYEG